MSPLVDTPGQALASRCHYMSRAALVLGIYVRSRGRGPVFGSGQSCMKSDVPLMKTFKGLDFVHIIELSCAKQRSLANA